MRIKLTFPFWLAADDRIAVIKFLREFTGAGLKQAKDAADSLWHGDGYRPGVITADIRSEYAVRYYSTRPSPVLPFGVTLEVLNIDKVWNLTGRIEGDAQ